MQVNKEQFFIPFRIWLSIGCFVISITPFMLFYDLPIHLSISFFVSLFLAVLVGVINEIVITENGIQLYKVNKLKWDDIIGATIFKYFGLRHIRISRKRGMDWLLPLYFVGDMSVENGIMKYAPKENPIYKAVQTYT